jgi:chemotaxis protein CheX
MTPPVHVSSSLTFLPFHNRDLPARRAAFEFVGALRRPGRGKQIARSDIDHMPFSAATAGKVGRSARMSGPMSDPRQLRLPEVLDMTFAGPLAESLLALRGAELVIDASRVQRVGAQCAQVIMSAIATWQADDFALNLTDPSSEFRDAFSLLGIGLVEITTEEAA